MRRDPINPMSYSSSMKEKPKSQRDRRNAFERAQDSILGFDGGWWNALAGSAVAEVEFSDIKHIQLGDESSAMGAIVFERRTVTLREKGKLETYTHIVTRPVMTRFSSLPITLLERLARDILEQSDAQWREVNLQAAIDAARAFNIDEAMEDAREILGSEATEDELIDFAEQMRLQEELAQGGEAAARFFDKNVSKASIEEDGEGGGQLAPQPLPAPGRTLLTLDEWDIYTPEEVADYDDPESDAAYAFRVVKLCEAISEMPDVAVQLGIRLGAVTREWEMWRENGEFIAAGRARFAQQSELSKSRQKRPWMTAVKEDMEQGRIGDNVASYALDFKRRRRDLKPPTQDRIQNFVSELRRQSKPE